MSFRSTKIRLNSFFKDFLLASRLLQIFQPLNKLFFLLYNFNLLTSWIHKHKKDKTLINDFYKPLRHYDDRLKSFHAIKDHYRLNETPIQYLEFGVASGNSMRWWLENCGQ